MSEYKTTFNYFLTHRILPQVIFSELDPFYESILHYPEKLNQFLLLVVKHAAKQAMNDSDIEPPYTIETFDMGLEGEIEHGVIWIRIPNCKKMPDCAAIAFPTVREKAGYFTCEYSVHPFNNREYFILGGWKIENDNFSHQNWGEIEGESLESFVQMVYNIAYNPKNPLFEATMK